MDSMGAEKAGKVPGNSMLPHIDRPSPSADRSRGVEWFSKSRKAAASWTLRAGGGRLIWLALLLPPWNLPTSTNETIYFAAS
jgi:hypothetical protein